MSIEVTGSTPSTPTGVCDRCSGDGERVDITGAVVRCEDCGGTGGTDPTSVAEFRRFSAMYRTAMGADNG